MQRNKAVFMIFFVSLTNALDEFMEQIKSGSNDLLLDDGELELIKSKEDKIIRKSGYSGIPIDMMTAIQGNSVSLSRNASRIEKLENNFKIFGSIALTIIGALITILLTLSK
jgi:hypothetical protein